MPFTPGFTALAGAVFTAAQYNTYVRDNFAALWPYSSVGDMAYLSAPGVLSPIAKGANGSFLKINGSGNIIWATSGIATASKQHASSHTYNSSTWRDMPNSSGTIVLSQTSTIQVTAAIVNYTTSGTGFRNFVVRINGVDSGIQFSETYQSGQTITTTALGFAASVPAGTITIVIREQAAAGDYTVERFMWNAIATPT